jgi:hypothetical protein
MRRIDFRLAGEASGFVHLRFTSNTLIYRAAHESLLIVLSVTSSSESMKVGIVLNMLALSLFQPEAST